MTGEYNKTDDAWQQPKKEPKKAWYYRLIDWFVARNPWARGDN